MKQKRIFYTENDCHCQIGFPARRPAGKRAEPATLRRRTRSAVRRPDRERAGATRRP